ncbi:MAG TPA: O-acetyl-ADP-ribose deacetylase [Ktedonobacteraceae bacterium]|nr:O-acetyl-ADP-ribose deacetylase [Ktedonobacteraceae bacterium]
MSTTRVINGATLELIQGDIVTVHADAIVNAANAALAGGGGVDGAIHRAGGPEIMEACRQIAGIPEENDAVTTSHARYVRCPTGSAVATTAGKLHARYVFHAVGPIYEGTEEDARLLASAYQSCLKLAEEHQIQSVAFPALSAGIYGYPVDKAAVIALKTIIEHLQGQTSLKKVTFVLFGGGTLMKFEEVLHEVLPEA